MAKNETRGLWSKETYPKAWMPRSARQAQRTVRCDWRASPRLAEYEKKKLGGCHIINGLVLDMEITEIFKQGSDMNRYFI